MRDEERTSVGWCASEIGLEERVLQEDFGVRRGLSSQVCYRQHPYIGMRVHVCRLAGSKWADEKRERVEVERQEVGEGEGEDRNDRMDPVETSTLVPQDLTLLSISRRHPNQSSLSSSGFSNELQKKRACLSSGRLRTRI